MNANLTKGAYSSLTDSYTINKVCLIFLNNAAALYFDTLTTVTQCVVLRNMPVAV